ncbi:FAD dependent oxidoreductase [Biscogniauxia mediterranea]|nr:FAD dependent oxidoreductase [Biscogniauxia mediterranea]
MAAQTVTPTTSSSDSIVILGAGIIGVSTAYYLSQQQQQESRPAAIHLVEPSPELFASASGYAGGFLARDWFAPAAAALGALSFDEHRRLAEREDGARRWGYAPSTAVSVSYCDAPAGGRGRPRDGCAGGAGAGAGAVADVWCREGGSRAAVASGVVSGGKGKGKGDESAPAWLRRREGDEVVVISEEGTVAQVDPLQLCQFLLQKCLSAGVQLHHPSRALSVVTDAATGALAGLRIATATASTTSPDAAPRTTLPCTVLVLAAGAWTPSVFSALFPASPLRLPISSLAGHSLVVENKKPPPSLSPSQAQERRRCHAVFLAHAPSPPNTAEEEEEEEEEVTTTYAPELFSRAAGGSIYVAGLNSSAEPLPPLPTDAKARVSALARLRDTAREVLLVGGGEEEGEQIRVLREGLCFRPVTRGGTPIVGRVPPDGAMGGAVYVAAGHGPWGISMGLGTGRVVAEMVRGMPLSADVAGLGVEEACLAG